ncbi:Uncharacterized protein Rs2_15698 [Raphanus sativus]|nr:Uncharacterized protein Rs2_15698 [Raphanus sativus]
MRHRAELNALNDQTKPSLQGSQGYMSQSSLKRPRSPTYGRQLSPMANSRNANLDRDDKSRKQTPSSYSSREAHVFGHQARDFNSSSRQDNRASHHGKEVWSRLEIPPRREVTTTRTGDRHLPRSSSRYETQRTWKDTSMEWRPMHFNAVSKNREASTRMERYDPYDREAHSRATYDSQNTISDVREFLESGEINKNKNTDAGHALAMNP